MEQKKICTHFLQGKCKFGDKCHFSHEIPQNYSENSKVQKTKISPNTCKFFLTNSCNKNGNCNFFHGFGDTLMHISTIENVCEKEMINLIKMDDTKFIVSDEHSFFIRFTKSDIAPLDYSLKKDGFKIGKMIFSNNKAIFGLKKEG